MAYVFDDDPARIWFRCDVELSLNRSLSGPLAGREEIVEQLVTSAWRVVGAYEQDTRDGGLRARPLLRRSVCASGGRICPARSSSRGVDVGLVRAAIEDCASANFHWMLNKRVAHGMYKTFGFGPPNERFLERPRSA